MRGRGFFGSPSHSPSASLRIFTHLSPTLGSTHTPWDGKLSLIRWGPNRRLLRKKLVLGKESVKAHTEAREKMN